MRDDLAVGDEVIVDESVGLVRRTWKGKVTYNDPQSPYITVEGVQVRKYEVRKASSGDVTRDALAEARRRQAAGEFLTQRQMQLLWEAETSGNPQYGPTLGERATPQQKAFWEEAQREAKEKYPIYSPQSLAEAKREGVTPEEMHLIIAHEMYKGKMDQLRERYEKQEWETPAGRRELAKERREEERERREEEQGL